MVPYHSRVGCSRATAGWFGGRDLPLGCRCVAIGCRLYARNIDSIDSIDGMNITNSINSGVHMHGRRRSQQTSDYLSMASSTVAV